MSTEKTNRVLQTARVKKAMSRKHVAEEIGVSENTIVAWETGEKQPRFEKIPHICRTYRIGTNELLYHFKVIGKQRPELEGLEEPDDVNRKKKE